MRSQPGRHSKIGLVQGPAPEREWSQGDKEHPVDIEPRHMSSSLFRRGSGWHVPALALLTLLTRIPFRSSVLYNWDSVNFALGVLDFNILQHRPHPPGYLLYVAAGKALTLLTEDPNASLIWLSIIAGLLAVLGTYALARLLFRPSDAFWSALLLLTSPLFWLYNEVALTYALEAFFSISIAYACFRVLSGSTRWAYVGIVLLGLAGGFRQTTILFMAPLAVYAGLKLTWRHRLGTAALVLVICLGWAVPTIASTGGLAAFLTASQQHSSIVDPSPATYLIQAMFYGGHLVLLLVLGYWIGLYRLEDGTRPHWEKQFLLLWLAPALLAMLLHTGQAGYVLFALPALFVYAAPLLRGALQGLTKTAQTRVIKQRYSVTLLVISMVGVSVFFFGARPTIRSQDKHWLAVQELPAQYSPSHAIVLADLYLFRGFRHASYYLREYPVYGFAIQKIKAPPTVPQQTLVLGWTYHSYQLQDNFDLDPSNHQLYTVLDLPSGTTGLLITHPRLIPENGPDFRDHPDRIIPVSDEMVYVGLPSGARRLAVVDGQLEIQR
jgi:hypothetical protein